MAPELIALLVCDTAVIDGQGKVSLHGLFDLVWVQGFPSRHGQLAIFWKGRFDVADEVRTIVEAPDRTPIALSEPVVVDRPGIAQAIHNIVGLEFQGPGIYTVRLVGSAGVIATTTLEVGVRQ